MSLHIYVAKGQPLVRFNAGLGITEKPLWERYNPRAQVQCHTCGFTRYARNLRIQVYYDGDHIFCADGHEHERGDRRRRMVPKSRNGKSSRK